MIIFRILLIKLAISQCIVMAFSPPGRSISERKVGITTAFDGQKRSPLRIAATKRAIVQVSKFGWFDHSIRPAIASAASSITAALINLNLLQKALFLSTFLLGVGVGRMNPFWKAYRTVQDIPLRLFGSEGSWIKGKAAKVTDGDTIRFYHMPIPFTKMPEKMKLSEKALPVRICTIDAPETAKFGKPGQAFGVEATEALKDFLSNKSVKIRLLQTDQYGRVVAQVRVGGKHVDHHLLKLGLAEVYEGGGAVYGPKGKDFYLKAQAEAKRKKLGIWSKGKRESAAEYKKRTKE